MCEMGTCGRSQRRIVPDAMADRAEQKLPQHSGESGWTMPVHCLKWLACVVLLIIVIVAFIFFIPLLPGFWKYVAYMLAGGLFALHLLTYVFANCIDPDHPMVQYTVQSSNRVVPTFDEPIRIHVLPDQYTCPHHITLIPETMHCKDRNKPISSSDHNCVGKKKYRWRCDSLFSAVAFLCCVFVVVVFLTFQCMVNPWDLCKDSDLPGPRTSPSQGVTPEPRSQHTSLPMDTPKPDVWLQSLPCSLLQTKKPAFLVLLVVTLLLDVASLGVLGKLLISHLYLGRKNVKVAYDTRQTKQEGAKSIQKDASVLIERAVDQPQKIEFLDSKGAGHESPATGGDPPVPAEGSTWLESFNPEALERPLSPRTPNPSSHSPSAPELLGTIQEGHKPQSLGLNSGANQPEEPSFQLECDLQQDQLPESKQDESMGGDSAAGGETAASGDMPSSQVATDLPAAQGEVRIDLSPVLSLHKSVVIPVEEKPESVVIPVNDDIGI